MAMTLLESGPKLDWTRDNQIFLHYKKWKAKVELIFRSALSQATPEEKTSYLKYWMGDPGLPLIEKWETTGKLDYSNSDEAPSKEGGRSKPLSSGFRLETYWKLLEEEFKPKGNKLLSIIELWTRSKQGPKILNEWLTYIHNLVEACNYGDSTDRIIRDVLIIGCESSIAKDKIIRRGETITLNEVIEILQTEASTNSTLRQFQEIQSKPVHQVNYVSYDSRSKKSKKPSNEQNSSSSTGSTSPKKRKCYQCGEPYSRKHLEECRAKNVTCNNCGIKGHFQKCCKKSGNFPKDNSNRENQSSSTGNMRYAATVPAAPITADFFDEKGFQKEYRGPLMQQHIGSMNVLRKVQDPNNYTYISDNGIEIQYNNSASTTGSVSGSVPTSDSPFIEFPSHAEVVNQSQIDISSISDTLDPRESKNSSNKATRDTVSPLKSVQNSASDEEMREIRDSTVSVKHTQSTRDPTTISISGNSNFRESTTGTQDNIQTALEVESSISFATSKETPEFVQFEQLSNSRSVMPTDVQALTVLQDLLSDDFQAKKSNSLQRKGDDRKDEIFQLIQKLHDQLQQVQFDLQRLHSLHKY